MKEIGTLVICVAVAGCMSTPPPVMKWNRTDGRIIHEDAALQQRFDIDKTECLGEGSQVGAQVQIPGGYPSLITLSAAVGERNQTISAVMGACMAKRGYLLRPAA